MRQDRCENCRFWVGGNNGLGVCHRYPPKMVLSDDDEETILPITQGESDWCGEFQPRAAEEPEDTDKWKARAQSAEAYLWELRSMFGDDEFGAGKWSRRQLREIAFRTLHATVDWQATRTEMLEAETIQPEESDAIRPHPK